MFYKFIIHVTHLSLDLDSRRCWHVRSWPYPGVAGRGRPARAHAGAAEGRRAQLLGAQRVHVAAAPPPESFRRALAKSLSRRRLGDVIGFAAEIGAGKGVARKPVRQNSFVTA